MPDTPQPAPPSPAPRVRVVVGCRGSSTLRAVHPFCVCRTGRSVTESGHPSPGRRSARVLACAATGPGGLSAGPRVLKQETLPWLLRTWPIRRPGGYLVARLLARLGHQHRVPCLAPPAKPEQELKEKQLLGGNGTTPSESPLPSLWAGDGICLEGTSFYRPIPFGL